ncbi:hypothetical protein MP228_006004 [Amoeboaphelidium protococcarum]|nr:hypothetical protein MP228_006004 [Amoeboaphelidium protococcarum]
MQKRKRQDETSSTQQQTEAEVGITEYLGSTAGERFSGILKQRYEDFIVNEIDPEGNVVRLSDISAPPTDTDDIQQDQSQLEIPGDFVHIISDDIKGHLYAVLNGSLKDVQLESEKLAKDQRTLLHQWIKKAFNGKLESQTKDGGIVVKKSNSRTRQDSFYLQFRLCKSNRDTHDALQILSRALNIQHKRLAVAGTKDKRGITTQLVTAFNVSEKHLMSANVYLGRHNIQVGNSVRVKQQLTLGDLFGNQFKITLRNIQCDDIDSIDRRLQLLKQTGFINYFGMQRFGHGKSPTHLVGKLLLQLKYGEVVNLLVKSALSSDHPQYDSDDDLITADTSLEDLNRLRDCVNRREVAASKILEFLIKNFQQQKVNYQGAILSIPRTLRMMYYHAYQSYQWNQSASFRLSKYGTKVAEGDLVLINDQNNSGRGGDSESRSASVKYVSAEDCGDYHISQVVLPCFGSQSLLPKNEVGVFIQNLMAVDGFDRDGMMDLYKKLDLYGDYRKIIAGLDERGESTLDLEWSVVKYNDATVPLVDSDMDTLENKSNASNGVDDGQLTALNLKFKLGRSEYATMLLRELMTIESDRQQEQ